jgi:hypothetical protein
MTETRDISRLSCIDTGDFVVDENAAKSSYFVQKSPFVKSGILNCFYVLTAVIHLILIKTVADKIKLGLGNPYRRGRLSTINLLIKIACFAKIRIFVSVLKAVDLN